MLKNILLAGFVTIVFSACGVSTNFLRFGELDNDVANKGKIINNFDKDILTVETHEDTESMSIILPKDNMTVRFRIKVANIEDVLYMNIVDEGEFNINKLIRRVSDLQELDLNQDGWMFEPSVEKGIITLQLYIPEIYMYNRQYNPKLVFSYKRNSRALQDSIDLHFIKDRYYPSKDKDGYEIPKYGDLKEYCDATNNGLSDTFIQELDKLNQNRVDKKTIQNLRELCQ